MNEVPRDTGQPVTLVLERDLFDAVEEVRYRERHASRTAAIKSLLREAMRARAAQRNDDEAFWSGGGAPTAEPREVVVEDEVVGSEGVRDA